MTWSTERRINAAFILAIGLLLGMAGVAFYTARQFNLASDSVPHTFDVWNAIQRSFSNLREVETGTRGFIVTGNDSFLGPYQRGSLQAEPALDRLRSLTLDNPPQQERVDRLEPMVATELALAAHAIDVRRREGFAAAAAVVAAAPDKDNMDRIRHVVQELRAEENRLMTKRLAKSRQEARVMIGALGVGLVFDFALLGAIYQITRQDRQRQERAAQSLEIARLYAESIVDTVREPLLILTSDLRVARANRSFYETFGARRDDVERRELRELDEGRWNVPDLLAQLTAVAADAAPFDGFEVTRVFRNLGARTMLLNARRLNAPGHDRAFVLLAIEVVFRMHRLYGEERGKREDAVSAS